MTFLVFMMGVSAALNVAVGFLGWRVFTDSQREKAAHERTRRDVAKMLVELERIRELAKPMRVVREGERKPMAFHVIVGTALARYESEQLAA